MTAQQGEKTVKIRSTASGSEAQEVQVTPGQTPRETLAEVVGRNSDQMMLRAGEDGYLDPDAEMSKQVRDGQTVHAVSNPKAG